MFYYIGARWKFHKTLFFVINNKLECFLSDKQMQPSLIFVRKAGA